MKNLLHSVGFAWKTVWTTQKSVYLYKTVNLLKGVLLSLIAVYFPAAVIGAIYPQWMPKRLALILAAWLAIQLVNSIAGRWMQDRLSIASKKIIARLKAHYGTVITKLRYEILEDANTQNDLSFTQKGIANGCEMNLVNSFFALLQAVLSTLSLMGILSQISAVFFVYAVLVAVVQSVCSSKAEKKQYAYDQAHEREDRKLNYAVWGLTGSEFAKEDRLFSLFPFIEKKFKSERKIYYKIQRKRCGILAKYHLLPTVMTGFTYFLVYGLLAYSLYQGQITVSDFVLFAGGILSFGDKISTMAGSFVNMKTQSRYISHFEEWMRSSEADGKITRLDTASLRIEFQNVWYRYPNQSEDALQGIHLTIESGQKIAIVGQNGSGKTTFIKLLMGLYKPTKGKILVNGIDLESIAEETRMKLFAPVFQDFFLTAYSVGSNIAFSEEDRDEAGIWDALSKTGVKEAVKKMPGGLACAVSRKLDDEGSTLSGGESQKLAIARAVYKNAPILILDEPTAALSPAAEQEIYKNFDAISSGKTALFISHRLASCRLCDSILVFEKGKILETGTHDSLMDMAGVYREMFTTQAQYYEDDTKETTA